VPLAGLEWIAEELVKSLFIRFIRQYATAYRIFGCLPV
jgi:hypothetical protein